MSLSAAHPHRAMSRATSVTSDEHFCQYCILQFCTDPCRKRAGYCKSYTAGYWGCNTVVFLFFLHIQARTEVICLKLTRFDSLALRSLCIFSSWGRKKNKTLLFPWGSSLFPNLSCKIPRSLQKEKKEEEEEEALSGATSCCQIVFRCESLSHVSLFKKSFIFFKRFIKASVVGVSCKIKQPGTVFFFFFYAHCVQLTSLAIDFKVCDSWWLWSF